MKEAVCVMPPFVAKMSCSFDMAYDSNYLDRMLQLHLYMEGAWKEFTANFLMVVSCSVFSCLRVDT